MTATLPLGRVLGIPLSVQLGAAVLAALFTLSLATQGFVQVAPEASLTMRLVSAGGTVLVFLLSVLAHELGHATVARRHGVGVHGITLSLFGGYAQLDRQAATPREECTIAVAGPLVNFALAGFFISSAWLIDSLDVGGVLGFAALVWLSAINFTLAVLNLLPASPLDGGRVVTAFLWRRSGDAEAARVQAGRLGLLLGAALVLGGGLQLWRWGWEGGVTIAVGAFLFLEARREIHSATLRGRLHRTTAAEVMVSNPPMVPDSLTLSQLSSYAEPALVGVALPVKRWDNEPVGYVIGPPASTDPAHSWTEVSSTMQRATDVARAWANEPLDDVLRRNEGRTELVVVVHEPADGRVVGTLSDHQIRPLLTPPDTWGRNRGQ